MATIVLHHFSEDPTIEVFEPHVPNSNPTQEPAVWAIDADHAPLYWFPRDCPRATAWPRTDEERPAFEQQLGTTAPRLHAMEFGWLERMRTTTLWRYDFEPSPFEPWADASGQWISRTAVEPVALTKVGDLFEAHEAAQIELRLVSSLWPIVASMADDRWDFSHVRLANAAGDRPAR